MSRLISDIDQEIYDRQTRVRRMVTGLRRLPTVPTEPPEDTVLAVANLSPDGTRIVDLMPAERMIAAEWERRADEAIRQIRAEHRRARAALRWLGEEAGR